MAKIKKSSKKSIRFKSTAIHADWKEVSPQFLDQLQEELKLFGLTVIDDPICEGSDTYGIIISNRPLTSKELEKHKENFGFE